MYSQRREPNLVPIPSTIIAIPLYGFTSDSDVIELTDSIQLEKYVPEKIERILERYEHPLFKKHMELFEPDYLLYKQDLEAEFSLEQGHILRFGIPGFGPSGSKAISTPFVQLDDLVDCLRLFKPGSFSIGATWVMLRMDLDEPITVGGEVAPAVYAECNFFSHGVSLQNLTKNQKPSYELLVAELLFFDKFRSSVKSIISKSNQWTRKVALGLGYFGRSHHQQEVTYQLIDLFMSLEALLLQENDQLALRLALRGANLLAPDAKTRMDIYSTLRDFYNVRSRLVHGSELSPRQKELLGHVAELRELTRRLVLAFMSLALDAATDSSLYKLLDEMSLSDERRKELQERASRLLYIS